MNETRPSDFAMSIAIVLITLAVAVGGVWGLFAVKKVYNVWSREQDGKAALAEAQWSKQVAVEQARAENDAAVLKADTKIKLETANASAEIERAKGVAEANRIIADSLKGNEDYLRYLWIDKLSGNQNVMYVPTEAGLPILEAGKRN